MAKFTYGFLFNLCVTLSNSIKKRSLLWNSFFKQFLFIFWLTFRNFSIAWIMQLHKLELIIDITAYTVDNASDIDASVPEFDPRFSMKKIFIFSVEYFWAMLSSVDVSAWSTMSLVPLAGYVFWSLDYWCTHSRWSEDESWGPIFYKI